MVSQLEFRLENSPIGCHAVRFAAKLHLNHSLMVTESAHHFDEVDGKGSFFKKKKKVM